MTSEKRFGMLRTLLRTLGLSAESVDDIVNWIIDLLAGDDKEGTAKLAAEFPYLQRDHFLSPAEMHFFQTLRTAVNGRAALSTKVNLSDLFWVKTDDQSRKRIYTNKIDRKHVDFLLCDPATMRPLVAIELDDKSHQRADRQERDGLVNNVFLAAGLPLLHIIARRDYNSEEIASQLAPYIGQSVTQLTTPVRSTAREPVGIVPSVVAKPEAAIKSTNLEPTCPKCGSAMILRTAKNGPNAGHQFWGCSKYPSCRGMMAYDG